MAKTLLIVESPAKAKTIEKYLGKDYKVKSSYGHVRDLDKKSDSVDVKNDFKPKYIVSSDKKKVVKELKDLSKSVDEVILATDEDREGEAISWHLCKVLGLDESTTKRIVFHEITKPAIQKAIEKPRTVDINLVNAQQARRILDRLVGFELSETLWKKVKGKLSAGRVQSVAVKLIVDREREIIKFEIANFFKVKAIFNVKSGNRHVELNADLPQQLKDLVETQNLLKKNSGATFRITNIEVKPGVKRPSPPFITSTLQQEASRKLGFSVKRTMTTAQKLYEHGHITYMRTDSTNLSTLAISEMSKMIAQEYGDKYVKTRQYKSKNQSAQEAHEAIRPTYVQNKSISGDQDQERLYDLIWKRAIASQMAEAKLEYTTVSIENNTNPRDIFEAKGEVLLFDGFLKLYLEGKDEEEDDEDVKGMLPPLKIGQILDLKSMTGIQKHTRPPARYTEATLVKEMEKKGIGRPSTYAPTITKIMEESRGYIIKDNRDGKTRQIDVVHLENGIVSTKKENENYDVVKNRLFPTDIGMVVVDFLDQHFKNIMDYGFTADIEEKFDKIANGEVDWKKMLNDFYFPFHDIVTKTVDEADRASGERILGKDPKSGRTLLVRLSRYGKPIAQIGAPDELEEDEKPKYANLKFNQNIESIELEEALELFKLPMDLGEIEGKAVSVNDGRFGPYIKWGDAYINIGRNNNPLEITVEKAKEYIEEKKKADLPVTTYKGEPVTQGKGRFGPFLKYKSMYVNIPKKFDPDSLDQETMHQLIEAKIEKESNRYIHQWEDKKISVENGRWGPFIRKGRKNFKLPKGKDGKRMTSEEAAELTLQDVEKIIAEQS